MGTADSFIFKNKEIQIVVKLTFSFLIP